MSGIEIAATFGVAAIFCAACYIIGYWSGHADSARDYADRNAALAALQSQGSANNGADKQKGESA